MSQYVRTPRQRSAGAQTEKGTVSHPYLSQHAQKRRIAPRRLTPGETPQNSPPSPPPPLAPSSSPSSSPPAPSPAPHARCRKGGVRSKPTVAASAAMSASTCISSDPTMSSALALHLASSSHALACCSASLRSFPSSAFLLTCSSTSSQRRSSVRAAQGATGRASGARGGGGGEQGERGWSIVSDSASAFRARLNLMLSSSPRSLPVHVKVSAETAPCFSSSCVVSGSVAMAFVVLCESESSLRAVWDRSVWEGRTAYLSVTTTLCAPATIHASDGTPGTTERYYYQHHTGNLNAKQETSTSVQSARATWFLGARR
eukprot:3592506-Rhodomonas_salina.1